MKKKAAAAKAVRFKSHIGLLDYLPGMHYVEIPKKVVDALGGKLKLRVICILNGKVQFSGGFMALGEGRAYLSVSKARLKLLGLAEGSSVNVELKPDSSRYGMEMPPELRELLSQDPEARKRFEGLAPSKQRYIIVYVQQVKDPDKRIERGLLLIQNLKRLEVGKESFREMLGLPRKREK